MHLLVWGLDGQVLIDQLQHCGFKFGKERFRVAFLRYFFGLDIHFVKLCSLMSHLKLIFVRQALAWMSFLNIAAHALILMRSPKGEWILKIWVVWSLCVKFEANLLKIIIILIVFLLKRITLILNFIFWKFVKPHTSDDLLVLIKVLKEWILAKFLLGYEPSTGKGGRVINFAFKESVVVATLRLLRRGHVKLYIALGQEIVRVLHGCWVKRRAFLLWRFHQIILWAKLERASVFKRNGLNNWASELEVTCFALRIFSLVFGCLSERLLEHLNLSKRF